MCENKKECENYQKYKKAGKKYCLICSKSLESDNEKEASEDITIFKHASEDL